MRGIYPGQTRWLLNNQHPILSLFDLKIPIFWTWIWLISNAALKCRNCFQSSFQFNANELTDYQTSQDKRCFYAKSIQTLFFFAASWKYARKNLVMLLDLDAAKKTMNFMNLQRCFHFPLQSPVSWTKDQSSDSQWASWNSATLHNTVIHHGIEITKVSINSLEVSFSSW